MPSRFDRQMLFGQARPRKERYEEGRERRKKASRSSHGEWTALPERSDPIEILRRQDDTRVQELVPIRYGRMLPNAFTFYRGAAAIMASDLASMPDSGITVQLCGDAHLANFGVYGAPDRRLVFDVNDFDETLPGPFEWDVKRLAASFVAAAGVRRFDAQATEAATLQVTRSYCETMHNLAALAPMDLWYERIEADDILAMAKGLSRSSVANTESQLAKARTRTNLQAFAKLTAVVDGRRRIVPDPPIVMPLEEEERPGLKDKLAEVYEGYRQSLADDRCRLLDRFRFVDFASKVVGVGSVGTRCLLVLLEGDDGSPLFLQLKEADASVLEAHLPKSAFRMHGRRVVEGQRLLQSASDVLLGWSRDATDGVDFYFRQLHDMKGSADLTTIKPTGLAGYGKLCGTTLAQAHARSGDASMIAGYVGHGDRFPAAILRFAQSYATQSEQDHARLVAAVKDGDISAETGK